jgi:hypothetical protein
MNRVERTKPPWGNCFGRLVSCGDVVRSGLVGPVN